MRKTILFSAAFLLLNTLFAQQSNQVVILQTTGKVGLISKGKSKAKPVVAGAVAKSTGTLKLGKGASAMVFCGEQYKAIKDTDKAELLSICGNAPTTKSLNADHELGEMIMAAVDMVSVAKARGDGWVSGVGDRSTGGDGWGTGVGERSTGGDGWGTGVGERSKGSDGWGTGVGDRSSGGDGWGGQGTSIRLIMPFGVILKGQVCFTWSKPLNKDPYRLEILDEKGNLVHGQTVQDTFVCLDLAGINLEENQLYNWQIKTEGANKILSNVLSFAIGSEKDREDAIAFAKTSSNQEIKELNAISNAVVFEKFEWFYDAHLIYADLQKNNPSNLAKMMHAAFWRRHKFYRLSEKAFRG